jgi:hypothetical protein
VISVPYQLKSSLIAKERAERELLKTRPGDVRRGVLHDKPTGRAGDHQVGR